jgi:eukaryotic-like serine/threonine-protein kinase
VLPSSAVTAVPPAAALPPCPHCGATHPPSVLRCPETDVILPLAGRLLDGRFKLLERIGRGGMASVWLARNVRVDRLVAIKLIRPEVARDDDMVARFRSEARAAGRIGNPNICDILDSGRSPIGPYIVMEVLKGASLGELLAEVGRLAPATAVMLVREALRGLSAAHRAGIVHRDLKPENIFLHRPDGAEPMVKLMDFGVAKFTDGTGEARTEHGALLGTPEYMAPEQFRGAAHAERRTDIWAMGAILYRALTGMNAFGGPTVAATLLMVASEEPAPLHGLAPDVPDGLVEVVMRCLNKDPELRFDDVAALDAALAPFDVEHRDLEPWQQAQARQEAAIEPHSEPSAITESWRAAAVAEPRPRSRRYLVAVAVIAIGSVGYAAWRSERGSQGRDRLALAETDDDAVASERTATTGPAALELDAPPRATGEHPVDAPPTTLGLPTERADATTLGAAAELELGDATDGARAGEEGGGGAADVVATEAIPEAPDAIDPGVIDSDAIDPDAIEIDDDPIAKRPPARPPEPPPPDPPGVVRSGRWVALEKPGPAGPHRRASDYCEHLARIGHLGISRWALPNPSTAGKLAGSRSIRKGRYWTSALWHGRAIAVDFPSGVKHSSAATESKPKSLCVARWP